MAEGERRTRAVSQTLLSLPNRHRLPHRPSPSLQAPRGFYQSVLHVSDTQSAESDIRLIQNCWSRDVSERSVYKMESENTLQALKDIVPAALNNINAKFILLDKDRVTLEGQHKKCLALVADETAAVHFQLWGDECDAFEPGDIILLANGIFSYSRNNLVLRAGKRGKVEKAGEFTMTFVETPNMSKIRWVHDSINSKMQEVVISPHLHIFPPIH